MCAKVQQHSTLLIPFLINSNHWVLYAVAISSGVSQLYDSSHNDQVDHISFAFSALYVLYVCNN